MKKIQNRYGLPLFTLLLTAALLIQTSPASAWGFYAHKLINKMAVYTLPPEMITFFKKHINYLSEHAGDPDKRSRGVKGEAEKHYIDIDVYGPNCFEVVPKYWKDAVNKYTEDTLRMYGINPWWIEKMSWKLMQAFKDEDVNLVLYYAANMGHYIADATVPLHTTQWYDGKIPAQKGLHAFWESRLPELYGVKYDYMVGRAEYIDKPQEKAWELITVSHGQVDTVLNIETYMRLNFPQDKMYVFETRGSTTSRQFSPAYSAEFVSRMNNMIERNLRRAILAVGSYWYTCWVNAGQPDLSRLEDRKLTRAQKKEMRATERMWRTGKPVGRPNPDETNP